MSDKLLSTKYEGVYYKEINKLYNGKADLSYYIMYRSHGKQIKKSVGKNVTLPNIWTRIKLAISS